MGKGVMGIKTKSNLVLNLLLDNQAMIMGMILRLDKGRELFKEKDIKMITKQFKKIKKGMLLNG